MTERLNEHAPCICGSGKEYHLCCKERMDTFTRGENWGELVPLTPEKDTECDEIILGSEKLYAQHGPDGMLKVLFERMGGYDSEGFCQSCFTFGNCLKRHGQYKLALEFVEKAVRECHGLNAATIALLAELRYQAEDERMSRNTILIAADMKEQDIVSLSMISEVMSLLKMHRELLDYLSKFNLNEYEENKYLLLHYLGIAYANNGDIQKAIETLKQVKGGSTFQFMAQIIEALETNSQPIGIYGDWPYPAPMNLMEESIMGMGEPRLRNTYWYAEFFRTYLEIGQADTTISQLALCKHPHAIEILEKALEWPYATKTTKRMAKAILDKQFSIEEGSENRNILDLPVIKIANEDAEDYEDDNERHDSGFYLNLPYAPSRKNFWTRIIDEADLIKNGISPIGFPKVLDITHKYDRTNMIEPATQEFLYSKNGIQGQLTSPKGALRKMKDFLKVSPQSDSISNMLALMLHHLGRNKEAEEILLKVIGENPCFLFAQSSLLDLYRDTKQDEKGLKLIESTVIPDEIHPNLVISFWCAAARFHTTIWQEVIAMEYLKKAEYIDYDNELCQMTREFIAKHSKIKPAMQKYLQKIMPNCIITECDMIDINAPFDKNIPFVKINVTEAQLKKILEEAE